MSSNGSSTHHSPEREELCCLLENGERCTNKPGSTVFSKKMKSLAQKKQKLYPDSTVSHLYTLIDTVYWESMKMHSNLILISLV